MTNIRIAGKSDGEKWNAYLLQHGVDHHAWDWRWLKVITDTFQHTPYYLIAEESDESGKTEICGVCPLFQVRSVLFGNALISVPYLNGGGILAENSEIYLDILCYIRKLAAELDVKYVELRNRSLPTTEDLDLKQRSHKVAMLLNLQSDPEAMFSSFTSKLRSQIRRPSKEGVCAKLSGRDLSLEKSLKAFYAVFAQNMRDLGTPVYPQKLFSNTLFGFGEDATVVTVWHNGNPLAAGILVANNCQDPKASSLEIPWASSLRQYNRLSANMLLYWESIKFACINGHAQFDFGRSSPDSGTYRFKKQWGSEVMPLNWTYYIRNGSLPDINPKSSKFSTLVACWQKMPLPLANTLGPWITRSLP